MKKTRISKYRLVPFRSKAGIGLKTLDDIPKDTFIIEYCGPLLTVDKADEVGGKYLFEVNSKWVIHGIPKYNKAGYINHGCRPNCETRLSRPHRIFIYSRKKIKSGEELTYNYGKEYFDELIKKGGCKCVHCSTKR